MAKVATGETPNPAARQGKRLAQREPQLAAMDQAVKLCCGDGSGRTAPANFEPQRICAGAMTSAMAGPFQRKGKHNV